jgi:hypothetical protein
VFLVEAVRRRGYAREVKGWLARVAAVPVLAAVLACSGLGICWQTFAPRGHSCCEPKAATSIGSPRSCASLAERGAIPHPVPLVALAVSAAPVASDRMGDGAFLPVLPARTPPLVLRI